MEAPPITLNAEQNQAAEHHGGPLLVQAGPGTGKTRTLTSRIAFLIREKSVTPRSILALTFTHRAAGEMRERLEAVLGKDLSERIFIGTFHALGFDMVRQEWRRLGFENRPVLYDEDEVVDLVRHLFEEKGTRPSKSDLEQVVDNVRCERGSEGDGGDGCRRIPEIVSLFEERKRLENAVDFNDLIQLPLRLLREDKAFRAACSARWRHILVDEYQDVNAAQAELIRLLAADSDSVMAIGDPDQAIYSFRGSDSRSFLSFENDFPGAEVVALKANYRSTVTILEASSQVIGHNRSRDRSIPCASARGTEGIRLAIHNLGSDKEEALFVSRRIEELVGGFGRYGLEDDGAGLPRSADEETFSFSDMAVLYRLNAQAREIRNVFERSGIPFQQVGTGRKGLDPRERAVNGLARLALSPSNKAATRSLKAIPSRARKAILADWQAADTISLAAPELLTAAAATAARVLPDDADAWIEAGARLSARAASGSGDRDTFLASTPLAMREEPYEIRAEKVTLSTLHGAKGLEFPVVFITGLEQEIIPYIREDDGDLGAALEEERRLLYVGMTRAMKRLFLTRARRRFLFGRSLESGPSPFLQEISEDLLRFVRERSRRKKRPGAKKGKGAGDQEQRSLF